MVWKSLLRWGVLWELINQIDFLVRINLASYLQGFIESLNQ